jgi:hypothetical protein
MVAEGNVSGSEVRNIFGWQGSTSTSFIPMWENATAYTYPGSALTMTVTTSSATDDGGTVTIIGLDASYNVISETVTANNATPPTTSAGFFRINDVIFSKTSGANVGTVTVANGGTTYAKILTGVGRNQASIFTVPAGKSFYLYRIDAFSNDSVSSQTGLFRNYVQYHTGQIYIVARTTLQNNMNIQRRLPFKYNEKTDIQFQLRTGSGTHEMNVFGEGILKDN